MEAIAENPADNEENSEIAQNDYRYVEEDQNEDAAANEYFIWNLFYYSILFLCLNFSVQLLQKHTQLPFKSQFQDYYTKPILFCLGDILGALFTATFYPFFGMKRIGLLSLSLAFFSSIGMLYLQDRHREYMQKHE